MKTIYSLIIILTTAVALAGDIPERNIELTYVASVSDVPADAGVLSLWIPIPSDNTHQEISNIEVTSPYEFVISGSEPYGNKMVYIEAENPVSDFDVKVEFTVKRYANVEGLRSTEEMDSKLTLAAQTHIPINDMIKGLALANIGYSDSNNDKCLALYNHAIDHLAYDKSGTGWGRGDFYHACDVGKGNCTDFHSYFIGLARNIGIPAYFEIGVSLPEERGEGETGAYHCWAYFNDGQYWIPVDISEADKHPEKKGYFFGNHDENRVAFSRGRDLILSPAQQGEPLNYFINPYAEIDGEIYSGVSKVVYFRDI